MIICNCEKYRTPIPMIRLRRIADYHDFPVGGSKIDQIGFAFSEIIKEHKNLRSIFILHNYG